MPGSLLGTVVRRVEDPDLLVGRSTFVDNMQAPDLLHAVFVRSPFAHALVGSVDTAEAVAAPGVLAVLTGADLAGRTLRPFAIADKRLVQPPLALDKVRYVGQPV